MDLLIHNKEDYNCLIKIWMALLFDVEENMGNTGLDRESTGRAGACGGVAIEKMLVNSANNMISIL